MGLFSDLTGMGKGTSFFDRTRYAKDFELETYTDKRGRQRQRARYTGPWTVFRAWDGKARRQLWGAAALALALVGAYGAMTLQTHMGSGSLLVMFPLLAGLFPALYLLFGTAALPFGGKPMRRDQYMHSFIRMSRSATAIGIFALVGQGANLTLRAVRKDWLFLRGDWLFVLLGLLSMAGSLALVILLGRADLTERENGAFPQSISEPTRE